MPSMTLLLNLGTDDAKRLGIAPNKARAGETVEVDDKSAEVLINAGWARPAGDDDGVSDGDDGTGEHATITAGPADTARLNALAPSSIESRSSGTGAGNDGAAGHVPGEKAIANAPAPAAIPATPATPSPASAPDFDGMTKAELEAYANDHKVAGVTSGMNKDEMLKHIKRAGNRQGR